MSEIPRHANPARCAMCDSYNLEGLWTCECGALNISRNRICWKCSRRRKEESVPEAVQGARNGPV